MRRCRPVSERRDVRGGWRRVPVRVPGRVRGRAVRADARRYGRVVAGDPGGRSGDAVRRAAGGVRAARRAGLPASQCVRSVQAPAHGVGRRRRRRRQRGDREPGLHARLRGRRRGRGRRAALRDRQADQLRQPRLRLDVLRDGPGPVRAGGRRGRRRGKPAARRVSRQPEAAEEEQVQSAALRASTVKVTGAGSANILGLCAHVKQN